MQLAFALPVIVGDAEALRRMTLLRDELVASGRSEVRQPLFLPCADPTLAVTLADSLRDRHEILAGIAIVRQWESGFEKLAVTRVDRTAQCVELTACIVDDPFDEDVVTA